MEHFTSMSHVELIGVLVAPATLPAANNAVAYPASRDCVPPYPAESVLREKLAAARELLLRELATCMRTAPIMHSPQAVREWLKLHYAPLEHEVFTVLHLDTKNRLIEAEPMFRGTLTQTSVYPREVVKSALAHNAASVIIAHNHPSGDVEPSPADRLLTHGLKSVLAMVDILVADHFIVAGDNILSFAEQGLL